MFVISNFLIACAYILKQVIFVFYILLILRFILSWVNPDPYSILVRIVFSTTEPLVAPFRRITANWRIGLDFSLFFAFLALSFIQIFLVQSLIDLAYMLK